jgi:hypothetical protein
VIRRLTTLPRNWAAVAIWLVAGALFALGGQELAEHLDELVAVLFVGGDR